MIVRPERSSVYVPGEGELGVSFSETRIRCRLRAGPPFLGRARGGEREREQEESPP